MKTLGRLLGASAAVLAVALVALIVLGASGVLRSPPAAATFSGPPAAVRQPAGQQGSPVLARVHGRIDEPGLFLAIAQPPVRTTTGAVFMAMRCSGAGRVTVKIGPSATWTDCRNGATALGTGAFVGVGHRKLAWHVGVSGRIAWAVTLSEG